MVYRRDSMEAKDQNQTGSLRTFSIPPPPPIASSLLFLKEETVLMQKLWVTRVLGSLRLL